MEKNYIFDLMLNHFVSNERKNLRKAYAQNGYIYASDGHILIRIKQDFCAKQYEVPATDFPDCEKLFRDHTESPGITYIIQTNDLVRLLAEVVWTRLTTGIECEECKGTGSVSCELCGSKIYCQKCDGKGSMELRSGMMTLLQSDDLTYSIRINECAYLADQLYIIALMATLSKADEIRYKFNQNNGLFSFGFSHETIYLQFSQDSADIILHPVHLKKASGDFHLKAKAHLKVQRL